MVFEDCIFIPISSTLYYDLFNFHVSEVGNPLLVITVSA